MVKKIHALESTQGSNRDKTRFYLIPSPRIATWHSSVSESPHAYRATHCVASCFVSNTIATCFILAIIHNYWKKITLIFIEMSFFETVDKITQELISKWFQILGHPLKTVLFFG